MSYDFGSGSSATNTNTISTPNTYTVTVTAANGCTDTESVTVTQNITPPLATLTSGNNLDCTNTSSTLTANGGISYNFGSGFSATNTNTISTPNTYTVTVTAANGCTDTESVTVTQNIAPPLATLTSANNLDCASTSSVLTANGGISYDFGSGSSATNTNTISTPNTYTVTVTAANGCTDTESVTISQNITPPLATLTSGNNLDCTNTSSLLTAGGGISYNFGSGFSATNTSTISTPNTYTVTVTAANGCTDTESVTISQNITPPLATLTSGNNLDCTNTSSLLTAGGGISYNFGSGFSVTNTYTISTPNTYTVTVTAANGCTDTESVTVTQNIAPPLATLTSANNLDCASTSSVLTANGGISYDFGSGSSATNTNTISTPNTYTVTVTAANGCTDTESVTVTQNIAPPLATLTSGNNLDCTNTSSLLTANGGISYNFGSGFSATNTSTISTPNTYTVTVTAANGCTDTESVNVTQNIAPPLATLTSANNLDCASTSSVLTANGGISYDFGSGSSATNTNTISTPNTYTVTVTAANGCTDTESVTISQNITPPLATLTSGNNLDCTNTSSLLTAGGGISYNFGSGFSATNTSTISTPNTYTVTVTAANGCTDTESVTISQNITPPLATLTSGNNLDCTNTSSLLTAGGGISYNFGSGFSVTNTYTISTPNTYTVTVTAANGCTDTESVTVTQNIAPPLATLTSANNLDCASTSSVLTANGGISYDFGSGSSATNTNTISTPNTYTVTVTAANGCTDTESVTVTQNIAPPLATLTSGNNLDCTNTSSLLTANGGISYNFGSGFSATNTSTISTPNTYTVTVTAANGCTDTESVNVTQNIAPPLATLTSANNLDCASTSSVLTANGGISYDFGSGSSATNTNTISTPNTYTVTVTAANGCTDTESVTVTQNIAPPLASLTSANNLDCASTSSILTAGGGISYNFGSGFSATNISSINTPNTYTVTVTAANGCTDTESVTVTQNITPPIASLTSANNLDCINTSSLLTAGGGISYNFGSGSSATNTNTISTPNTYTVTVTAANGCTDTESVNVTQNIVPPLATLTSANNLDCASTSSILTAGGGISYNFGSGFSATNTSTISTPNTYTVTVTATNGCTDTESVTVSQNITPPLATLTSGNNLDCTNTSSTLTAGGGISYNFGSGFSATNTNTISTPNTYTVTVTAANGCTDTESVTVSQNITPPLATLTSANNLDCTSTSSVLTAGGGISYNFGSGFSVTNTNTISTPNTYTVTVTAANGCTDTEVVNVTQNITPPVATLTSANNLNCTNTSSILTAGGGISYNFGSGFSATNTSIISTPNTYTVTVTAANGCTDTEVVNVTQNITPPLASLTSGNNLDCTNTSSLLTAGGGISYNFGSGFSSTNTSIISTPNTYTVTVTAANGCTDTEVVNVTQNITPPLATLTSGNNLDCTNTSSLLTANGGISYNFGSGFSATNTSSINTPNTYTVTVTAANGCTDTESVTVTQNITPPLASLTSANNLDCTNTSSVLTAGGGISYNFGSGFSVTNTNTISTPNTYTVTVTAANGCTDTESVTVTQNIVPPLATLTSANNLDCTNTSSTLTAGGGISYNFGSGFSATNTNTISTPNTYTVTVTAANGCTDTESVTVSQNIAPPLATLTSANNLDCTNTSSLLTANGGISYNFGSGFSVTNTNTISTPNTYTVTVTTANGCTDTESVTVSQNITPPLATLTSGNNLDCTNTSSTLTAGGGISYNFGSGFSATNTNTISTPNTYTVTVTTANGCTDTESVTVSQNITPPLATLTSANNLDCTSTSSVLTAGGGISYNLGSGFSVTNTNTISTPNTYTVTVTTANGCTDTESVTVSQNITPPLATLTSGNNLDCTNTSSTLTAGGGISYNFGSGFSVTNTNTISTPNTYTVTVTAANGCTDTESVTVTQNIVPPLATLTSANNLDCTNTSSTLTAGGGISYNFGSGFSATNTNTISTPNTYTVTVTAANGCTDTESVTVSQNIAPPLATLTSANN
jgi:hypothetical protein